MKKKSVKILKFFLIIFIPYFVIFFVSFLKALINIKGNNQFFTFFDILLIEPISFTVLPLLMLKKFYNSNISNYFKQINLKKFFIVLWFYAGGMMFFNLLQFLYSKIFFNGVTISRVYVEFLEEISKKNLFLSGIAIVLLAPLKEELFFRYSMGEIRKIIKYKHFIIFYPIFSSLLFSLSHFDIERLVYLFGVGLIFATIFLITENLIYTIIIHLFINFVGFISIFNVVNNNLSLIDQNYTISGLNYTILIIGICIGLIILITGLLKLINIEDFKEKYYKILLEQDKSKKNDLTNSLGMDNYENKI